MPSMTLPSSRTLGRAVIVGSPVCRQLPLKALADGSAAFETESPYEALAELCRKPAGISGMPGMPGASSGRSVYDALIISLQCIYREELQLIAAARRAFGHLDIWLCQTDGRPAALAEALNLGDDGILSEDGLHRLAAPEPPAESRELRGGLGTGSSAASPEITAAAPAISPADDGLRGGRAAPDHLQRPEQNEPHREPHRDHSQYPPENRSNDATDSDFRAPADLAYAEPIVSAEELAALLQELPSLTPGALLERGH